MTNGNEKEADRIGDTEKFLTTVEKMETQDDVMHGLTEVIESAFPMGYVHNGKLMEFKEKIQETQDPELISFAIKKMSYLGKLFPSITGYEGNPLTAVMDDLIEEDSLYKDLDVVKSLIDDLSKEGVSFPFWKRFNENQAEPNFYYYIDHRMRVLMLSMDVRQPEKTDRYIEEKFNNLINFYSEYGKRLPDDEKDISALSSIRALRIFFDMPRSYCLVEEIKDEKEIFKTRNFTKALLKQMLDLSADHIEEDPPITPIDFPEVPSSLGELAAKFLIYIHKTKILESDIPGLLGERNEYPEIRDEIERKVLSYTNDTEEE